jgi:tetratricopeptide (TPR) repeat protein
MIVILLGIGFILSGCGVKETESPTFPSSGQGTNNNSQSTNNVSSRSDIGKVESGPSFDDLKAAQSAQLQGDLVKAETLYTKVIGDDKLTNTLTANALHNLAGIYLNSKKKYSEAYTYLNNAIALNPSFPEAYFSRGNYYSAVNDKESAIEDYTKAIQLKPDYYFAYFNRGNCYDDLTLYDKAYGDYESALRINPQYEKAAQNMKVVDAKRKKAEAALKSSGSNDVNSSGKPYVGMSYQELKSKCTIKYDEISRISQKRIIIAEHNGVSYNVVVENDKVTSVQ